MIFLLLIDAWCADVGRSTIKTIKDGEKLIVIDFKRLTAIGEINSVDIGKIYKLGEKEHTIREQYTILGIKDKCLMLDKKLSGPSESVQAMVIYLPSDVNGNFNLVPELSIDYKVRLNFFYTKVDGIIQITEFPTGLE